MIEVSGKRKPPPPHNPAFPQTGTLAANFSLTLQDGTLYQLDVTQLVQVLSARTVTTTGSPAIPAAGIKATQGETILLGLTIQFNGEGDIFLSTVQDFDPHEVLGFVQKN